MKRGHETQADVTRVHRRYLATMTEAQKVRFYRRHLKELLTVAQRTVLALDEVMKQPPTEARGKQIARVVNYLDLGAQSASRFALGRIWPRGSR